MSFSAFIFVEIQWSLFEMQLWVQNDFKSLKCIIMQQQYRQALRPHLKEITKVYKLMEINENEWLPGRKNIHLHFHVLENWLAVIDNKWYV